MVSNLSCKKQQTGIVRLKYFALPTELPPVVCSDSREDRTRTYDTSAPRIEVSQHIAVCCICSFVKQAESHG